MEITTEKVILTVSELNRTVKKVLESQFAIIWIEGEVSNLSRPQSSGHIYFTLKDSEAQVRCAMFRMRTMSLPFDIQNGMQVVVYAKISLYEGRGDYQLIVEHIEERGKGLLRQRFEILKAKLAKEGLFDSSKKKSLPLFPKKIGVITSATGAAVKDVLSVLKRRFSAIPIIIYPTAVQGEQAPAQIVNAIQLANDRKECDVLIICRGGGSLEDLWAFNEEVVAHAIFYCEIPIVSGIGHEIDFTIADFVADFRAATPSAAAELISPNQLEYQQRVTELSRRLLHHIASNLKHFKLIIQGIQARLADPSYLLQQHLQTLDILSHTLLHAYQMKLATEKNKLELLANNLHHQNPIQHLNQRRIQLSLHEQLLNQFIVRKVSDHKQHLATLSRALNAVSPLHTLERGYSITLKEQQVIDDIAQVKKGDLVTVQVRTGYLLCQVTECISKRQGETFSYSIPAQAGTHASED